MTNLGAGALGVVLGLGLGIIILAGLRELADKRFEAARARRVAECEKSCRPDCPIPLVNLPAQLVECWCSKGIYLVPAAR